MKKFTNRVAALYVLAAILVPTFQPAIGAAPARISDVGLTSTGSLVGQVVDSQGQPVASSSVAISATGQTPVQAVTNEQGYFSVEKLPAGVYLASTSGAARMVRVWAPRTAPPAASNGVLLVEPTGTARAQEQSFLRANALKIGIGLAIAGGVIAIVQNDDDAR